MNIKVIFLLVIFILLPFCSIAQDYKIMDCGITANVDSIHIKICFFDSNIVEVKKYPEGYEDLTKEYSVIKSPNHLPLEINRKKKYVLLRSASVKVKLDLLNGRVSFYDRDNKLLLNENEAHFYQSSLDTSQKYSIGQSYKLTNDEAIYGLGQHQDGVLNKRNQRLLLLQRNKEIALPFFQSLKGYGLFWDNYSTTVFQDTLNVASFKSEGSNNIDYYFIKGKNADQIIAGLRKLTGQVPMLPLWAFGYWQSRERYKSQKELINVIKKYRDLKVPLDVIVQDWKYWGENNYWNATKFRNPNFPDPKEMIKEVHQLNAHIAISVWPSFGPSTNIYKDLNRKGLLFDFSTYPSTSKVYNAFNPQARNIYWKYLKSNLFSLGIDAWWLDGTEPIVKNSQGKDDKGEVQLSPFLTKYRNAFPLVTTGGVYMHQRKNTSKKRVVILTRSAFIGQQRYGTIVWSGDVDSGWKTLRNQIAAGLSFSMSGLPYWTTDIGGFYSGKKYPNGVKDPRFQELYVRWLQFETFIPIMRSHGTDTPREIYKFGKKGYWTYDIIDKFIKLRYRLLPYIYSNAWKVTANASTMMRALIMDFPNDQSVRNINNEFMFGNSFLVCPITTSLGDGRGGIKYSILNDAIDKKIYLPHGTEWYNFWTGKRLNGGQYLKKKVSINTIPLYVRAGSIIPMGPILQYTKQKPEDPIELRIYEGSNGSFTFYEDEDDNYDYEKGSYSTIKFEWNDESKTLTIEKRNGSFPGMLKKRTFNIVLVSKKHGTGLATTKNLEKTVVYKGEKTVVTF
jgi:alpha-D-xyloside xylohydrolase